MFVITNTLYAVKNEKSDIPSGRNLKAMLNNLKFEKCKKSFEKSSTPLEEKHYSF
jgi:hypothetical protein